MYARHDLVWLGEAGWDRVLSGVTPGAPAALAAWRAAGWPAIVRRADADAPPGEVALGIPLPPRPEDGYKVRIPIRVPAAAIVRHQPPLALARAMADGTGLPPGWRTALADLDRQAQAGGLALHVYGSTALQALTGQRYLGPASDIDLLLQPRSRAELAQGLALLQRFAAQLPLDGEIVFPGGCAVAWKEWACALGGAPGTRVLVKELHRVALVPPDALLAALEEEACLP